MKGFLSRVTLALLIWLGTTGLGMGSGVSSVSLRAVTLNGAPLMQKVSWVIYETRRGKRVVRAKFHRHSGSINLRYGQYIAALAFANNQYEQPFNVSPNDNKDVIIVVHTTTKIYR